MGVMPYRLEKGPFPLIVEHYFNEGLDEVDPAATVEEIFRVAAGPRRRLRAICRYREIGHHLRHDSHADLETVTRQNSLILSGIFNEAIFGELADHQLKLQEIIGERWLGLKKVDGGWERHPVVDSFTAAAREMPTVGHWSAYYGNVELIMVETLQRMLEVSLGIRHMTEPPGPTPTDQEQCQQAVSERARHVWPLYLFLTCPQPWFETWITWQCHAKTSAVRGQVTVMLSTPGHERPVTPSPIDMEGDKYSLPVEGRPDRTVPNPYYLHGVEDVPFNSGYVGKVLRRDGTLHSDHDDPTDTTSHDEVGQGMWVVTHANHDSTIAASTFDDPAVPDFDPKLPRQPEAWDLPPIAHFRCAPLLQRKDVRPTDALLASAGDPVKVYRDVVVVSPASRDGGVPNVPLHLSEPGGDDVTAR